MSVLLHHKRPEAGSIVNYYGGLYCKFFEARLEKTPQFSKIETFLMPVIYQRWLNRRIDYSAIQGSIDDTISRAAIWNALFCDMPLPNVEENAVEKYAGSLDKYLPDNIPIDNIVRHAKG